MMSKRARAEMPSSYLIEPIGPETIERTYPLAQAVIPTLSKHEWMQSCHCSGVADGSCVARREREDIAVARNAKGYIKGLCMYVVRAHATYGRLIDVPFFVASSAADGEGVTGELINFLMGKCDRSDCSGIRIWGIRGETWADRRSPSHIARNDHGLYLPALGGAAGAMKSLRAHGLRITQAIDRLSR
jgi:hypothetical protein